MRSRLKNLSIDEAKQKLKVQKTLESTFYGLVNYHPLVAMQSFRMKFESLLENKKEKITFC